MQFDATWYRTSYREKIDFDLNTFKYANAGSESEVTGYEFRATFKPEESPWQLTAYVNPQRSRDLAKVPKRLAGAEATYDWGEQWLTIGLRHVGPQFNAAGSTQTVDDYTVVYAAAGWRPRPNMEFYLRGENLSDEDYVENPGFTTIRPSLWAGLKAEF